MSGENPNNGVSQGAAGDTKSVRVLLLNELKSQYQQEWELRKNLDDKAKNVITVSGIVTALVFGSATFMTRGASIAPQLFESTRDFLTVSIIFVILSILVSALSLRLQKYVLAFSHASFQDQNNRRFDKNKIKKVVDSSTVVFRNTLIDNYLEANRLNATENKFKTIMVTISQWLFFVGMLVIAISLVLLLTS